MLCTTLTMYESIGLAEEIGDYSMTRIFLSCCITYFKCRLPDNQTDIPDKVIAIADGALWFMIDKELNPSSQCIWHRQSTCLSFEALALP